MFCVHCGAAEQSERAYCKRCGKWLGQSPPEHRMLVSLVFSAVSAVFGAASAIAIFSALGTKAAAPTLYMAAAFCCVISIHQTISFFFQLELFRRLKQRRSDDQSEEFAEQEQNVHAPRTASALTAADTPDFIRAPSV